MGGEKGLLVRRSVGWWGSPPHGRGKALSSFTRNAFVRITPAWAGKSALCRRSISFPRDHPRMGGEKGPRPGQVGPQPGSPPRGRGKANGWAAHLPSFRITPAWAGKSWSAGLSGPAWWDHPRVGGEKRQARTYTASCQGSPPRGRGKVALAHVTALALGITPAWAGKSGIYDSVAKCYWDHPRMGGEKAHSEQKRG